MIATSSKSHRQSHVRESTLVLVVAREMVYDCCNGLFTLLNSYQVHYGVCRVFIASAIKDSSTNALFTGFSNTNNNNNRRVALLTEFSTTDSMSSANVSESC